jgi:hypothetical protein
MTPDTPSVRDVPWDMGHPTTPNVVPWAIPYTGPGTMGRPNLSSQGQWFCPRAAQYFYQHVDGSVLEVS